MLPGSIVACIDKRDGAVFKAAAVSRIDRPGDSPILFMSFSVLVAVSGECAFTLHSLMPRGSMPNSAISLTSTHSAASPYCKGNRDPRHLERRRSILTADHPIVFPRTFRSRSKTCFV